MPAKVERQVLSLSEGSLDALKPRVIE